MEDQRSGHERLVLLVSQTLRLPLDAIVDTLQMQDADTWDSLTHMELVAAIEDTFVVELSADDIVTMTSVSHIRSVLAARGVEL